MKKLTLVVLLSLSMFKSFAQWDELTAHPNLVRSNGIFFTNDSIGFIAAKTYDTLSSIVYTHARILKTTNWGSTWTNVFTASIDTFGPNFIESTYMYFSSPLKGYMIGNGAKLVRTFDGGNNWIIQPFPLLQGNNILTNIYFTDSLTGYLCTEHKFFKTTDGGDNWSLIPGIDGSPDISFPSKNVGYMFAHKTIDEGNTWTNYTWPLLTVNLVEFINDSVGFLGGAGQNGFPVANFGSLVRTTDGAATWTRQDFNMELSTFKDMDFVNDSSGYAIGGGSPNYLPFWKTNDAGINWYQQTVNYTGAYPDSPWCLHCPSPNVCYIGCYGSNKIYRTKNGGGPLIGVGIGENTKDENSLLIYPNPTQEVLNINYVSKVTSNAKVIMYNTVGEVVYSTNQNLSVGRNQLSYPTKQLSKGLYFISIQSDKETINKKFTKN